MSRREQALTATDEVLTWLSKLLSYESNVVRFFGISCPLRCVRLLHTFGGLHYVASFTMYCRGTVQSSGFLQDCCLSPRFDSGWPGDDSTVRDDK